MDSDKMDIVDAAVASTPASQMQGAASTAFLTPAGVSHHKPQNDVEAYQAKLSDKGFQEEKYGDPLSATRPLGHLYTRSFPEGLEARLLEVMAAGEQAELS